MASSGITFNFGIISDDPRKLYKNVSWLHTTGSSTAYNITCYPTDNCDYLNPTVLVAYDVTYLSQNYAKQGDRYYFINNITLVPGGKMLISMSIDVLMTYRADIRNCKGMITRCTWSGRTMIPDDQFPIDTNKREIRDCVFKQNPRVFNATQGSIIIQTVGGDRTAINNNNE